MAKRDWTKASRREFDPARAQQFRDINEPDPVVVKIEAMSVDELREWKQSKAKNAGGERAAKKEKAQIRRRLEEARTRKAAMARAAQKAWAQTPEGRAKIAESKRKSAEKHAARMAALMARKVERERKAAEINEKLERRRRGGKMWRAGLLKPKPPMGQK